VVVRGTAAGTEPLWYDLQVRALGTMLAEHLLVSQVWAPRWSKPLS
jgi:hypothetical protein